ncbi:MAG: polymer-forming cytoskeletal protein [Candidatus Omnitrophica bacterium]|nr:polymer-forming cytoskeletal protein [Candidatus Omnitrophota bacterium]MBU4488032.1 polymer-forming cytoskeletal protein [Candidatus Omnitrophota bacterium]MCG2704726.1 polymer-forming cytoskeletal protein [Candidatus Omnitrophota bacterium]
MMKRREAVEKVLDVDATMQGSLTFKDPVNLRINGSFDGTLDTKGTLTISESAIVRAEIRGESIIVAGRVYGNIIAERELKIIPPAHVTGNVTTPRLNILDGAVLDGECHMTTPGSHSSSATKNVMTAEELAKYLEVETPMIFEWASSGKLPAFKDKDNWKFERNRIDEWIANGKVI